MSQADLPTGPLRPTIVTKEQTQFNAHQRHESLLWPQSRNLTVCPGTAIDKHFVEFVGPGGSINCKRCGDKHTQEDFGWKFHFNKRSVTNRVVLRSCGPLPLACLNEFKNTQIAIADWSK